MWVRFYLILALILCMLAQTFAANCNSTIARISCTNVSPAVSLDYPFQHSYVQEIIIRNSTLPRISPNSALWTFPNLKILNLRNLSIAQLFAGAFDNLLKLQDIDLSYNKLTRVPEDVFKALVSLKSLRLTGNRIENIDTKSFHGLRQLEDLFLDYNNINQLSGDLFKDLVSLKTLDISNNPLRNFPRVYLSSLKFFYASGTHLRTFDTDLVNSSPLWRVNISRSGLVEVNFEHFSTNALDLSNNNISSLRNWPQLNTKFLFLSHNNITLLGDIPKNITDLFLRHNQIKDLGDTFLGQKNIRILDLGFNKIEELTYRTFRGLEHLQTLYLLHNNITVLRTNIFQKCANLKYLDLSQNKIEVIESGAFNGMTSLSHLNISNNNLGNINFEVFANLGDLINLSFSHNRISRIDVEEFMDCTSRLKYIQLNYNAWTCDGLREVLNNLKDRNVKINDMKSFYGHNIDGISCKLQNYNGYY